MGVSEIVKNYLLNLETKSSKLVGFYQQGSSLTSNFDEHSDYDFIVMWKETIPFLHKRKELVKKLGYEAIDFRDIPTSIKSIELFKVNNKFINIAHVLSRDFFKFYKDVQNPKKFNPAMFVRLGGLRNSKIIYDTNGLIKKYTKKVKVTPRIRDVYYNYIKKEIEQDLYGLKIASERRGVINFLRYFYDLVENLSAAIWLSEGNFPDSLKRYEISEDNNLTDLLKKVEKGIDKKEVAKELISISNKYGFKPSDKPKA